MLLFSLFYFIRSIINKLNFFKITLSIFKRLVSMLHKKNKRNWKLKKFCCKIYNANITCSSVKPNIPISVQTWIMAFGLKWFNCITRIKKFEFRELFRYRRLTTWHFRSHRWPKVFRCDRRGVHLERYSVCAPNYGFLCSSISAFFHLECFALNNQKRID